MDTLKALDELARLARQERPPAVDIGATVLQAVRARQPVRVLPLSLLAVASAAAAAVIVALAVNSWLHMTDPLTELFAPLQMGML